MKIKLLLIAFIMVVIARINTAGAQSTFQKLYSTVPFSQSTCIRHTNDGGFVFSGGTGTGYWMMKANAAGAVQWSDGFGTNAAAASVVQTFDGGYAATSATDNGFGKYNVLLMKFDASGTVQWSKTYGDTAYSSGIDLKQTSDSGFIIASVIGTSALGRDLYLVKTNSSGTLQWSKKYSTTASVPEYFSSVIEMNGGYFFTGNIQHSSGNIDAIVLHTDFNGTILWSYQFNISGNREWGFEIKPTQDGNLVVTGSNETVLYNPDAFLMKLDTSGNILWAKNYASPGPDFGFSVIENADHGFTFAGGSDSLALGNGNRDVFLVRTNSIGNIIWNKLYGGNSYDQPATNGMDKTNDGGYIIHATTINSFTTNFSYNNYVIKTDSNGNVNCNELVSQLVEMQPAFIKTSLAFTVVNTGSENTVGITTSSIGSDTTLCTTVGINEVTGDDNVSFSIYPNPVSSELTVSSSGKIKQIKIFDLMGKEVYSIAPAVRDNLKLQTSNYENGIYFIQIKSGKKTETQKLIVQH